MNQASPDPLTSDVFTTHFDMEMVWDGADAEGATDTDSNRETGAKAGTATPVDQIYGY